MSVTKTITVMGATGSIGQSTLALVRQFSELFSVQALVAGSDAEGLAGLALTVVRLWVLATVPAWHFW